jgi:hypothetical protein
MSLRSLFAGYSGAGLRRLQETPRVVVRPIADATALRGLRVAPYSERHGQPADVPDEPRQLTGHRNDGDVRVLAACDKLPIASAQAYLRVPGAINDRSGMPSCLR